MNLAAICRYLECSKPRHKIPLYEPKKRLCLKKLNNLVIPNDLQKTHPVGHFYKNPLKIVKIVLLPAQNHVVLPAPMARKCWIARNERKAKTVAKYADLRHKLKKEKDYVGLTMLPRDASPTRLVNRCEVTGRRRAFLRRFRLSRITCRQMASHGLMPGVTKSSW